MSSLSTPVSRPPADAERPGPLLVLLDPSAREADGESVRIAKDVLCGGADVKVALPESPSELDRVLAHRGRRRAVVIGSDQALQRVLQALHRQRELDADPVGLVPVGGPVATATARLLGVPAEPVAAARAVLAGTARRLDLLLDDGGGVVLAEVRFTGPGRPGRGGPHGRRAGRAAGVRYGRNWLRPSRRARPARRNCASRPTAGCWPTCTSGCATCGWPWSTAPWNSPWTSTAARCATGPTG